MIRKNNQDDGIRAVSARWLLPVLMVLAMHAGSLWAGVRATLDRTTVYEGDTVMLTVETEGRSRGSQPDLSPLQKDFNVLGTSTSQQIQIINGQTSSQASLRIELEPKHTGSIEIPALQIGGETTRPLSLQVLEQPPAVAGQSGDPLFMEIEVEPEGDAVFVQQQIRYTTRLYSRLPLLEGSLSDPAAENAVVERLGDGSRYQTTVNGQRYQVVERHYAIFPEQSGAFSIPPVTFTGRVATGSSRRSPSGRMDSMLEEFFGRDPFAGSGFSAGSLLGDPGKRVRTRSRPVTLEVKPRPSAYSGTHWLPGEDLVLRDSWSEQPPEFRIGEPVTRVISIEARGLAASQLPDLQIPAIAGMRVYPEAPTRESRTDGSQVYGQSEQSIAFVPAQAGRITLPEIRLSWWDVRAGREQVAVLPAWEVEVQPGPDAGQVTPVPPQPANEPVALPDTAAATRETQGTDWMTRVRTVSPWLAGITLLVLMVIGSLMASRRVRRSRPVIGAKTREEPSLQPGAPDAIAARRALRQACEDNDANAAARAMLAWAASEWPVNPPRNLGAIAARLAKGADEVRQLDQSLYAPGDPTWNGAALWSVIKQGLQPGTEATAATGDGLEPLYPDWSKQGCT